MYGRASETVRRITHSVITSYEVSSFITLGLDVLIATMFLGIEIE